MSSPEAYLDNSETFPLVQPHTESGAAPEAYLFPCTIVQKVCWFLDQMSPGSAAYNIAVRFSLHGRVRPELLRNALCEIVRRHEILRTRFVERDGEPKQLVEAVVRFELPVTDLRGCPQEDCTAEAERIAVEEARIGFDLARGPLFRGRLLRTGDEEYVLLLTMHHIVSDGWSVGVITDELGAIYEALVHGEQPRLPDLPIQYADYACWQQDWVASGELEKQLQYWAATLNGFQPLNIPTDKPRPSTPVGQGDIRSVVLPRALTDGLKELSDRHGCTLFVTMLTAFVALMHYESGQADIVLRTQTAGRARLELEPLIGWFVNSIVLRNNVARDVSFGNLLRQVRDTVLSAFDHQETPFERLMESIRPAQTAGRGLPFQVNFIFQRDFVKPWCRGGLAMTPIPSKAAGTFVDLNFFLVERADGWRASVDVNTDVFHPATGEFFLKNFQAVLEAVASRPDVAISEIPLLRRPVIAGRDSDPQVLPNYAPPTTPTEKRVAAIWERVLGVSPVGVSTNFFDLGGHSLLAVQILAAIQKELGGRVQLAHLFSDPTVAAMARVLDGSDARHSAIHVLPVQPHGSRPPLFMVGGDHWFRPLAQRLSSDQPFLGLSLQCYEGRDTPTPFEEIAADLAATILQRQPHGPYFVSGWCVDGAVAFEVARQLEAAGHDNGMIVLIDAVNPDYRRRYQLRSAALWRALRRLLLLFQTAGRRGGWTAFVDLYHGFRDLGARTVRRLLPRGGEIEQNPIIVQADPDRQEFRKLLYRSERRYTPQPTSWRLLLLRTVVEPFQDPALGWASVARGSFEVIEVPGDHIEMFREPHVEHLARVLSSRLLRVQDEAKAPFLKAAAATPNSGAAAVCPQREP